MLNKEELYRDLKEPIRLEVLTLLKNLNSSEQETTLNKYSERFAEAIARNISNSVDRYVRSAQIMPGISVATSGFSGRQVGHTVGFGRLE